MPSKAKCPHCKQFRGGRPLQRGTTYHADCYEDAIREQQRKREAALLSKAARDQYWDRWVCRVRVRDEPAPITTRSVAVVVRDTPSGRWAELMAGRVFEDV